LLPGHDRLCDAKFSADDRLKYGNRCRLAWQSLDQPHLPRLDYHQAQAILESFANWTWLSVEKGRERLKLGPQVRVRSGIHFSPFACTAA
jgi:hypothetical protein